ncbi:unnamed protein product, partial [Ectocarpus sp. 12 AP-2014]
PVGRGGREFEPIATAAAPRISLHQQALPESLKKAGLAGQGDVVGVPPRVVHCHQVRLSQDAHRPRTPPPPLPLPSPPIHLHRSLPPLAGRAPPLEERRKAAPHGLGDGSVNACSGTADAAASAAAQASFQRGRRPEHYRTEGGVRNLTSQ